MNRAAIVLLLLTPVSWACGLGTRPISIPEAQHVERIDLVSLQRGGSSRLREVGDPVEIEAICSEIGRLNAGWLSEPRGMEDHQYSVIIRSDDGVLGFYIGPTWMTASYDLVRAIRYRRLSTDERAALQRLLAPD